jgi:hypothetical protein
MGFEFDIMRNYKITKEDLKVFNYFERILLFIMFTSLFGILVTLICFRFVLCLICVIIFVIFFIIFNIYELK